MYLSPGFHLVDMTVTLICKFVDNDIVMLNTHTKDMYMYNLRIISGVFEGGAEGNSYRWS
jgi:hypothetical protein